MPGVRVAQPPLRFWCWGVILNSFLKHHVMVTVDQELQETFRNLITQIAQKNMGIETLETRNSDSLDFHEVAVWQIQDALTAAFVAGMEVAVTVK